MIVEGEQAIFNVRQRVARETINKVEDENRKPVAGALLTLTAPRDGSSVGFSNDLHNIPLGTDEMGRAVVRGIRPNHVQGRPTIRITAGKDGMNGSAEMQVLNAAMAAAAGSVSTKLIGILAATSAAAVGLAGAAWDDGAWSAAQVPGTPTV
ncbi:MAG: hypothetical protein ACP5UT_01540 [Bryobacteraceae bacterium]